MIGCPRNGLTKFQAKFSQVRLTNNTTTNIRNLLTTSMEKEEMTEVELSMVAASGAVEHIRKSSGCSLDLVNWPNHGAKIDSACMQHAIQISEPGSLLLSK